MKNFDPTKQNWSLGFEASTIGAIAIIFIIYLVLILGPLKWLVDTKVPSKTRPNISARQELQRRGSWPIAYSTEVINRYKT